MRFRSLFKDYLAFVGRTPQNALKKDFLVKIFKIRMFNYNIKSGVLI
jgi:hypothetical protein